MQRLLRHAYCAALALVAGACLAADTPPVEEDGYLRLGFDRLASYRFVTPKFDPSTGQPQEGGEEQIPAAVKAWSGRKAIVTGFMLPVKMEGALVTEFLLVKDAMMCCYGIIPNMNEWIVVRMPKGVRPLMDVPIDFHGVLKVGAMFENGYLVGIYLLEGEKMGQTQG